MERVCSTQNRLEMYVIAVLLTVCGRKVLRRIFGPTKERDGTWRIKTSDAFHELIRPKNIINYIKAQRLSWFGHLHRMSEEGMVKKYISGNRC